MLEHCIQRSDEDYDKALSITSRILTSIYQIEILGEENLKELRQNPSGLIVLARHPGNAATKYLDILASGYFLKEGLDSRGYYVAKASIDRMLKKIKPFTKLIGVPNPDRLGQIVVHRRKETNGRDLPVANEVNKNAYQAVAELYEIGEKIVICPEGGSTSGRPFKPKESVLRNVVQVKTKEDPLCLPLNIQYFGRKIILTAGQTIRTRNENKLYEHLMESMK